MRNRRSAAYEGSRRPGMPLIVGLAAARGGYWPGMPLIVGQSGVNGVTPATR